MADTGWKSPTTATGQWTNNNNALSEDGNFSDYYDQNYVISARIYQDVVV
jgi:hypothetical protein